MQTATSLIQTKTILATIDLFGTRHAQHRDKLTGEPLFNDPTTDHILQAHKNLDLLNKPYPSQHDANCEVLRIQAELDRMMQVAQ